MIVRVIDPANTTVVLQRCLDRLKVARGDEPVAPIVRDLLAGSAHRLRILCSSLLHRSYPRLTRPPFNLEADEMLSAVVERLLKALRNARPGNVRQFFALANQHMRWELNDLARRMEEQPPAVTVQEEAIAGPEASSTALSANARRILDAIERLPEHEREVFSLVRVHGLTHAETAAVVGTSTKTVQRRLNRSLILLTDALGDLTAEGRSGAAGA